MKYHVIAYEPTDITIHTMSITFYMSNCSVFIQHSKGL